MRLRPGKKLKGLFAKLADQWHLLPDKPVTWRFSPTSKNPGNWQLNDMRFVPVRYTKRKPADAATLRRAFDGSDKQKFLKHVQENVSLEQLTDSGMTSKQAADFLRTGVVPSGYQVHHILPLDDSGTNEFANLVLIKNDVDHKALTQLQRSLTSGMRPGDVLDLDFPMPQPGNLVWPLRAATPIP